jgi:hypothetical protein
MSLGTTAITDRRTQRSSHTNMCDPNHDAKVKLLLCATDGSGKPNEGRQVYSLTADEIGDDPSGYLPGKLIAIVADPLHDARQRRQDGAEQVAFG